MKKISEQQIELAIKLYSELKSLRKVSEIVGFSRDTISRYVLDKPKRIHKSINVVNYRKNAKYRLVDYKGGKCCICGYDKCLESLQFHHLDPSKKDFTISGKTLSWEKLKSEVDKCVLLCANCHGEVHANITELP